ncbi:MAG TPA: hypothetical protein VH250_00940 [Granulicella sp.]|nr:hypothetical protein [Granulicella sp.]
MDSGKKAAIGATVLLLAVVGIRVGMLVHQRHVDETAVTPAPVESKANPDDLVFLRQLRPDSMKDIKGLVGKTLWVSAGGQMDYYLYAGHKANYAKSEGILLGADPLIVKDAIEQVAPKSATFRIPGGDRQVLLVFTLPKSAKPETQYAVPIGYHQDDAYTFEMDEIFFYDDPHVLYKHWGADRWAAIDAHKVIPGMSERQVELALGQVSKSESQTYGNRTVTFDDQGHPVDVTFTNDKATNIRPN